MRGLFDVVRGSRGIERERVREERAKGRAVFAGAHIAHNAVLFTESQPTTCP